MHVHKAVGASEAIMLSKIGFLGFWFSYILVHVLENQDLRPVVVPVHVAADVLHVERGLIFKFHRSLLLLTEG